MNKYKMKQKIISILLIVAMIIIYLPISGVLAENTGSGSGTEAQKMESSLVTITQNGQPVSAINLPENEKTVLTASCSVAEEFQWQILVPDSDVWVNIYDKTTDTCEVSYALVSSMLDSDSNVSLRCMVTVDGLEEYSDPVIVTITESTAPEPESNADNGSVQKLSATSYSMEPGATGNYGISLLAEGEELTTRTVTIKYLYYNEGPDMTGSVANDYVATLATGTGYSATVSSPVRTGYKPYVAESGDWNAQENHWFTKDENGNFDESSLKVGETYQINIENIQVNQTYYIVYLPQDTTFNVSSYLQNIYDDFYTFGGSTSHNAKVGSSVLLLDVTRREGFTTLQYDDAKVAADGSTILEVYYDREYHLMNFQMDGGYGVEPVYARYQTGFKVSTPTRAGYTFDGWEVSSVNYEGEDASEKIITDTSYAGGSYTGQTYQHVAEAIASKLSSGETVEIPPFDITFKAKWTAKTVQYSVVYWKENANDDGYSYWGTVTVDGTAGETVAFNPNATEFDIAKQSFSHNLVQEAVNANGSFSAIPARYEDEYFTYNAEKSNPTASATVNGDNSTVLNVYYSRNTYNLKFYYARTSGTVTENETEEYERETEIVSGEKYVVEMNRAVENGAKGSVLSTNIQNDGLQLFGNMGDANITSLKFTVANADDGTYYIQSDDGKYLTVEYNVASFSSEKTELRVVYNNGYWAIGDSSKTYWLNHFGGRTSTTAKGYTEDYAWPGTYLNLYKPDATKYKVTKVSSTANWQVATSTLNPSVTGATWFNTGSTIMPSINDNRYTISSETIDGYHYYYLELKGVKYEQQIADLWPSGVVSDIGGKTLINWGPVDGCAYRTKYGGNASIHIYSTVSAEIINDPKDPGSSKFVGWWGSGERVDYQYFHIYYTPIPGEETDTIDYKGDKYVQQPDIQYIMAYNGYTRIDSMSLYGVTLVDSVITSQTPNSVTESTMHSSFYYKRNSHKLKFYNIGTVIKEDDLVYGQSISRFNTLNADTMKESYYPAAYEVGAYRFKGWSLSPDTYIEVDWDNLRMDDADLSVYAFWEKVTHTVTFYETYNALKNNQPIADGQEYGSISYNNPQTVSHGDPVNYASTISREGYNFVGWFYIDEITGEPVAFLPNNMPVNKDLKIYAEWQADTMIKYTIHYMLIGATRSEDGDYLFADGYKYKLDYTTKTQIADDTTGQIQDGRTKTFSAKALPELWTADDPNNTTRIDYCHNHYPMLSSHAIMFSPNQDESDSAIQVINVVRDEKENIVSYEIDYTFYYVKLDNVKYTVRYINNDTKTSTFKDFSEHPSGNKTKEVDPVTKTTYEAVTTESMKMIQGYVPDEYQKRIVLTAFPQEGTDDNVITFYYTENSSPMYFVEHLIENADGTWTQMAREFSTGTEGETITRTANNYEGHTFNANQGWVNTSGEYILPGEGENWICEESTITEGETKTKICIGGSKYTGNPASASGTLQGDKILVIRFYYTLEEYDYVIEHRILGKPDGDNWLFGNEDSSTEKGKAKYGSIVTADASQWETLAYEQGYWVEGDQSDKTRLIRTMQITSDSTKNVITFWYVDAPVEIEYQVVVDGVSGINVKGCYVTPTLDSTSSHGNVSEDVKGSVPTAGTGYHFAGWYKDEGCTQLVNEDWVGEGNKLIPKPDGEKNVIFAATYYAKFEPIRLTISKEGENVQPEDTFLFRIEGKSGTATAGINITVSITGQGSTTVSYIPAGDYTIKELTDWSWRYSTSPDTCEYKVTADGDNKVTFTNTPRTDIFWLGGENSLMNKFAAFVSSGS